MNRLPILAIAYLLLALPTHAAVKASLQAAGKGVQIVVTGAGNASSVEVKAGKKFKLKKKGAKWLSAILTGEKAKAAGAVANAGKISIAVKGKDGKKTNVKTALAAKADVFQTAKSGGPRPAEVRGGSAIAAFQSRISGRILRWVDNPGSYNSSETIGFAPNGQAVYYYFSPATVGSSADQKYYYSWSVTDAIMHPASLPTVEIVGQVNLGGTYYNIAFYYTPQPSNNPRTFWEGVYVNASSGSGEAPFYTLPFTSESQIGP